MRTAHGFGMDAKKGLIIVLAMVLLSAHPAFAVPGKPGVISGYVLDATTGAPIQDAAVTVTCDSGDSYSKLTSSKGKYFVKIKNVPTNCEVSVQAEGYQVPESVLVAVESGLFSHADFMLNLESGPVDDEAPTIEVEGVDEGAYYNHEVSATVTITDDSQYTSSITLDGNSYASGTEITEGSHVLTVVATDEFGNSASETVTFTIDKSAPSIVITGVMDGAYYNSESEVSATVTISDDNLNGDTVIVLLDGKSYKNGDLITADGTHVLRASAFDLAGNYNSMSVAFTIDETTPIVNIISPVGDDYLHSDLVALDFSVYNEVSIEPISVLLNGIPVDSGTTLDLLNFEPGLYTLEVTVKDSVGNIGTATVTFNVIVSIDSLRTIVDMFYADGDISNEGTYNSLVSKINAAEKKLDSGNEKAANNILDAFIAHVEAQRGKRITEGAADALIAEAEYIIQSF